MDGDTKNEGAERSAQAGDQVAMIVDTLRQEIISGDLPPNQPLGQVYLADRFGVSRMPVREAIWHLENLGLVTIEPNKRARVAPVSRADFLEIHDMRIAAESLAIRNAIPELSNAQIDRAAAVQGRIEACKTGEFGPLNTEFHMTLYRASRRPRLLAHIQVLGNAADRYQTMMQAGPEVRRKSDLEHHELLRACRDRNADAAVECLARHIGEAKTLLAETLDEL